MRLCVTLHKHRRARTHTHTHTHTHTRHTSHVAYHNDTTALVRVDYRHGDLRSENVFFSPTDEDADPVAIDFQMALMAPAAVSSRPPFLPYSSESELSSSIFACRTRLIYLHEPFDLHMLETRSCAPAARRKVSRAHTRVYSFSFVCFHSRTDKFTPPISSDLCTLSWTRATSL
jgi:hypothetical protein